MERITQSACTTVGDLDGGRVELRLAAGSARISLEQAEGGRLSATAVKALHGAIRACAVARAVVPIIFLDCTISSSAPSSPNSPQTESLTGNHRPAQRPHPMIASSLMTISEASEECSEPLSPMWASSCSNPQAPPSPASATELVALQQDMKLLPQLIVGAGLGVLSGELSDLLLACDVVILGSGAVMTVLRSRMSAEKALKAGFISSVAQNAEELEAMCRKIQTLAANTPLNELANAKKQLSASRKKTQPIGPAPVDPTKQGRWRSAGTLLAPWTAGCEMTTGVYFA